MPTTDKQDLIIQANQFIDYIRTNYSSTPLTIATREYNNSEYPTIVLINGSTKEKIGITFKPTEIETSIDTYPFTREIQNEIFNRIAEDIESQLL